MLNAYQNVFFAFYNKKKGGAIMEKKKPIYKRKWFIVLAVIIVLSVMFGGSSKEKKSAPKSEGTASVEKTCHMGELLKVGKMEYKVVDMSVKKQLGSEYINQKAQGVYLLLSVEVTNRSDQSVTVSDDFFKLKNGKKTYDSSSDAALFLGDKSIIFKKVNPDTTLKGMICFDVNENIAKSNTNILEVQTGIWGTEKGSIALKKA
jgi:hypothetical protein